MINEENDNWSPNKYIQYASFVPALGLPVLKILNPIQNEKILDLGCGDGSLSIDIARCGADVIGIDKSNNMIQCAKNRGVKAFTVSAEEINFCNEFDAVFSNAALHWIQNQHLVIKNVWNSLKDGGRFVAEFGGYGNIKSVVEAMQTVFNNNPKFGTFRNPWFFPQKNEYIKLLEDVGFKIEYIELTPRPTKITNILNWLDVFANDVIIYLDDYQKNIFKEEIYTILKSKIYDDKEDAWILDYVRLRLRVIKCKDYRKVC